jgi:plastocyanin
MRLLATALMISAVSSSVFADNTIVDQIDKTFSKEKLSIKVGDSVEFRNSDPFFHNVFSLSDAKFFDLGSYPQGESRVVEFDQPGTVQVECSIHPEMQMVIEVAE